MLIVKFWGAWTPTDIKSKNIVKIYDSEKKKRLVREIKPKTRNFEPWKSNIVCINCSSFEC